MPRSKTLCLTTGLAALLSVGCQNKSVDPPLVRLNQDPAQRVKLLINTGGPDMEKVDYRVHANYQIVTPECVPLDHNKALGGVRPLFFENVNLETTEATPRSIGVELFEDYIVAENYYGLGDCYWEPLTVEVRIDDGSGVAAAFNVRSLKQGDTLIKSCSSLNPHSLQTNPCIDAAAVVNAHADGFKISARLDQE